MFIKMEQLNFGIVCNIEYLILIFDIDIDIEFVGIKIFITIKNIEMTRPFQYDTYVKSQIGIDNDYDTLNKSHLRSTVQKHQGPFYHAGHLENVQEVSSRASLRNKINELLGLAQDQNKQVNSEFNQVMGAESQILGLLKQEAAKQITPSNYMNSNVQNYPSSSGIYHNQSGYGPSPDPYQSQHNYGGQNYQSGYVPHSDSYHGPQQAYGASPHHPDFGSGNIPQDKTQFLKSKVQELMEQNKMLKYQTSQVGRPQDDQQIRYLQQEIQRLRALIPQYEAQINRLKQTGQGNKLIDLLDQGQRIRQQTLALLKSNGNYSNSYQDSPGKNEILAELDHLRSACKQLEQENLRLKRKTKGTQYTSLSRGYY